MAFIVKKKIHGKDYFYLRESKRVNGKVKSIDLGYLGKTKKQANLKMKEKLKKKSNQKIDMKKEILPTKLSVEDMAMFCKKKGFVYQSGEIYGGISGFWDFGHLGSELKKNIKKEWWSSHVFQRKEVIGVEGSVITHPRVWKASGHLDNFNDVFVVCKKCKKPGKVDKYEIGRVKCECGGEYDKKSMKDFGLMFKTKVGLDGEAYLRPETAQLIFTNFKFIYDNARMKLPFGIAQVGRSFRNEIAPRDFLFRSREFEQLEMEYFIKPEQKCPYKIPDERILIYSAEAQEKNLEPFEMKIKDAFKKQIIKKDWHAYWLAKEFSWFKSLGASSKNFRIRQHLKDERSHYATDTWDLEYNFPFGWKELEGISDRGDYDLSQHQKFSKKDLSVFDETSKKKILPHVICEPSLSVERALLVFMFDSYYVDKERDNVVLKLSPKLSPIKAAIFPLVKRPEFEKIAEEVLEDLQEEWNVVYDKSGSLGRRYSRQDEIGTPITITVDEQTPKDNTVTLRDRDTTQQVRVKISHLRDVIRKVINNGENLLQFGKKVNTRVK